jgi:hypothetical protein
MKKWAIYTLFMSIILGFCQKIHTFSLPTSIGGFRGPGGTGDEESHLANYKVLCGEVFGG